MQRMKKYHKTVVEVLDQIIEKFNASKDGQEQSQFQKIFERTSKSKKRKILRNYFCGMEFLHILIQKQKEH